MTHVLAGQITRASDLNNFEPIVILKSANESVTSSTTLQNDDDLLYAIPAVGTYVFDLHVGYIGDTTGDFQGRFTFPSGTLRTHWLGAAVTLAANAGDAKFVNASETTSPSTVRNFGASGSDVTLMISGVFVATATGTLQFQWAQDVSSATALTVKSSSYLKIQRVA